MRRLRLALRGVVGVIVIVGLALIAFALLRGRSQDLPWIPLDLGDAIGLSTGRKLTTLTQNFPQCLALLDRAGVHYTVLPARRDGATCGYADGVRFAPGGARQIAMAPKTLGLACPIAAALAMWEWDVLQPAARAQFGTSVTAIDHYGSYSCRRMNGHSGGGWSEHATADAVDIAGFRLADGTRITVARDWRGNGKKAVFLHAVRDGACRMFATTLSPDYNTAHADHLHLDQATRGIAGGRACR